MFFTTLIAGFILFFSLKEYQLTTIEDELRRHLDIIELATKEESLEFNSFAKKFYEINKIRVTIISSDGEVIAESQKDPYLMDNHNLREEILMAKSKNYGSTVRYSDTIEQDLMYVAKKIAYLDAHLIVRLAVSLESIKEKTLEFWFQIIIFILAAIIITLFITTLVNKKISKEIKALILDASGFSVKTYPKGDRKFLIHEFSIIYNTLVRSGKKLKKIDKQKRKYDAKIRIKNRQQKDMISAISHEFKNPIAVIRGYSDTLVTEKDMDENLRNRFLEKIQKNSLKLNNMVDRFTLAIKLETDDFNVDKIKFSLKELIEDVTENLTDNYSDREIIVDIEDKSIFADRTLIEVAIKNLIENALKYSKEEIKVTIENNKLCVIDSGIGIEEENIENITKKFYRVTNMNWNNSMGLGLFIVSYILKLHNCKLEIESEKNRGSKFFFEISPLIP